ncbi:MAG: cytochrome c oxidase assembly protein [Pseudomonadota bacterium]
MDDALKRANKRLALKLLVVVVGAVAFGYALVPFYAQMCRVLGINGKTGGAVGDNVVKELKVDESRWVTVEFTSQPMPGLPFEFKPVQNRMKVHPGEITVAQYHVKNTSNEYVRAQAVPSVAPGWAAVHFKKLDCFCFKEQQLKPGEEKNFSLTFFVSPEFPKESRNLSLQYAFFTAVKKGS